MTSPQPRRKQVAPAPRQTRSDGQEARQRLLYTALALFAEHGFAKTSTRAIAQAAGANVAAISYYFGDKAGLYAACFSESMGGNAGDLVPLYDDPALSLEEALRLFLTSYVEPLKHGEIVRQCIRLHLREVLETTGQRDKEIERDIKGPHLALLRLLERHLGVKTDDDLHRLAFAIAGLSQQLYVNLDFVETIRPTLLRDANSVDAWAQRLVGYALALVEGEARRRQATSQTAAPAAPAAPAAKRAPRRAPRSSAS